MKTTTVAVLSMCLVACAHRQLGIPPPSPESFTERWVGHQQDDVLIEYGKPTDVLTLSNGHGLLSYHSEKMVSSSRSVGTASAYSAVHVGRGNSTTLYCDRRFEIDQQTVVRALIAGDGCY